MAHKKGGGSTRNGRDSNPKMLGVKAFDGDLHSRIGTAAMNRLTCASRATTVSMIAVALVSVATG